MIGLALLSGIGFTVSLLITELAYADQPERLNDAKAGGAARLRCGSGAGLCLAAHA